MSAEVDTNKEEQQQTKEVQKKSSLKQKFLGHWQIGIKILELLLCSASLGCVFNSVQTIGLGNSDLHHVGIMYTAYAGFILINVIFLISHLYWKEPIPYKTSALFSISAAALFLITGVLLLVDRSAHIRRYSYNPEMPQLTMLVISVVFAFLNVAVFVVDAVFTFRRQQDF